MAAEIKEPDERKRELIAIALNQFLKNGYEKTSIRSIVKEAGGEVGMFYHYFTSKNQVYEAALRQYNQGYLSGIKTLLAEYSAGDIFSLLDHIFVQLQNSLAEYAELESVRINPEMALAVYASTMQEMVPLFEQMICRYFQELELEPPVSNLRLLSDFLLYGTGAIIHDERIRSAGEKQEHIKILFQRILGDVR